MTRLPIVSTCQSAPFDEIATASFERSSGDSLTARATRPACPTPIDGSRLRQQFRCHVRPPNARRDGVVQNGRRTARDGSHSARRGSVVDGEVSVAGVSPAKVFDTFVLEERRYDHPVRKKTGSGIDLAREWRTTVAGEAKECVGVAACQWADLPNDGDTCSRHPDPRIRLPKRRPPAPEVES